MSLIETNRLTKRYGQRVGVDSLTLQTPEGSLFGFLGPNGAGKSTAIRLLLGLMRPTSGSASIFGLDVGREGHRVRREVGYLPGDLRLYSWLTVRSALTLLSRVRGCDVRRVGMELAERFTLATDVKAQAMSRGMRQKLGLVMALAPKPKLLILDEPTSGLDPLMQQTLYETLRERAAAGATVFFSSHALSEVEALCDQVAILRDGRLVAEETIAGLREKAPRRVTIHWPSVETSAKDSPPHMLTLNERRGAIWRGVLTGDLNDFLTWISARKVTDLTVERPDLETIFRAYYSSASGDNASGRCGAPGGVSSP